MLVTSIAMTGTAQAQTISYADAMTTLADACGSDINKLCKGVNLGGGQIAACLEQHRDSVSAKCVSTLTAVMTSIEKRLNAQAKVFKTCEAPAKHYCQGAVGDANILHCLVRLERLDDATCAQAIADAGWRAD